MEPNYKDFTDFLKDNRFLRWQMNPDEQLDEYWKVFQEDHPYLKDEINKARGYLKDTVLNKSVLSSSDRIQILRRIESEINQNRKKSKSRLLLYISAFSAAAVVLLVVSLKIFNGQFFKSPISNQEVIVGSLLNDEEIQLITSERIMSFEEDVQVEFDSEGNARIVQGSKEEQETVDLVGSKSNKLVVPYGKRSTLTLADGSKVWLNSGSVLEFPTQFAEKSREIHLASGELYIEVAPDASRPFFVMTSDMKVEVSGTKFNVTNYADSPKSVVLVEGRVSVQAEHSGQLMLSPDEQAILTDGNDFSIRKVDVEKYTSWKSGYFVFDNTPLSEVLLQIERYYNLSINFEQSGRLNQITCEGKLILSENIDNVMNTVAFLSKSTYHRKNNKIYIFSND